MLTTIRRLWDHLAWADDRLLTALEACPAPPEEALREYAHILGACEVWLSRLEGRPATTPVWPQMDLEHMRRFAGEMHAAYARYFAALEPDPLAREVAYTTTDGRSFSTATEDILLQVALHAQYHRGKVNHILRAAGLAPAAADFILFARSTGAA
jgi:uncharacterized damage-inducible protein DinB